MDAISYDDLITLENEKIYIYTRCSCEWLTHWLILHILTWNIYICIRFFYLQTDIPFFSYVCLYFDPIFFAPSFTYTIKRSKRKIKLSSNSGQDHRRLSALYSTTCSSILYLEDNVTASTPVRKHVRVYARLQWGRDTLTSTLQHYYSCHSLLGVCCLFVCVCVCVCVCE